MIVCASPGGRVGILLALCIHSFGCMDYSPESLQNPHYFPKLVDPNQSFEVEVVQSPACDTELSPDAYEVAISDECTGENTVGSWDPVVEWSWGTNDVHPGYDQVMSMPVAGNMTDDNGDGLINEDDIPDIAFTSFSGSRYSFYGALNVLSGDTGEVIWSQTSFGEYQPRGATGVALADLGDGNGLGLFLMTSGGLSAVNIDGTHRWTTAYNDTSTKSWTYPAVFDMEGDGIAEIVVGRSVFEADGTLRWRGSAGTGSRYHISYAMDLDGDGLAEVIAGDTIYNYDGSIHSFGGSDGFTAVADLNEDGQPDIVTVSNRSIRARELDGTVLWQVSYSTEGLYGAGGGPPTIADFDGDGQPEIGLACSSHYRVFEGHDGSMLWQMPVIDPSSSVTSSSVFDFEGDGSAEVVYGDEHTLWVFDGATGAVEMEWDTHSSGTLLEYPVIVDIDKDGTSEIVVASSNYQTGESNGITVIGDADASWAPGRPIWNQHAYSISNIRDDGTVPASVSGHWSEHNSFRAGNSETRTGLDQFDVRVGEPEWCLEECSQGRVWMWVPVENGGFAKAEELVVEVHHIDATGEKVTIEQEEITLLREGQQMWLGTPVKLLAEDFDQGHIQLEVYSERLEGDECRTDNNSYIIDEWPCDEQ
jgi:hypothetical protein